MFNGERIISSNNSLIGRYNLTSRTGRNRRLTNVNPRMKRSVQKINNVRVTYARVIPNEEASAPEATAPEKINNLQATVISSTEIQLNWTAPITGGAAITDYEYKIDGGSWTSTATTSVLYNINLLNPSTTYQFMVRAINSVGPATNSNQVSATTQAQLPPVQPPPPPPPLPPQPEPPETPKVVYCEVRDVEGQKIISLVNPTSVDVVVDGFYVFSETPLPNPDGYEIHQRIYTNPPDFWVKKNAYQKHFNVMWYTDKQAYNWTGIPKFANIGGATKALKAGARFLIGPIGTPTVSISYRVSGVYEGGWPKRHDAPRFEA